MNRSEWWLTLLLRLTALGCLLSVFAVFLPHAWMAWTHEWLGLGEFPPGPVIDYLARSVAFFYAAAGAILWLAAMDVRRYGPLIRLLALAGIAFGIVITASNVIAGMPRWWQVGEALSLFPMCIVVLWLGGHALHWPHNREFNLNCDPLAARVALDSGVPFVRFPCAGVTTHLRTSPPEVARYVEGQGAIGDYLANIFYGYDPTGQPGWSKVIWDIVTVAYLIDATWTPSDIVHTPILTDQLTWSFDDSRHLMRSATYVKRNEIFGDLFRRLAERAR